MKLSIRLKPIYPLFFGERVELSPRHFVRSTVMPNAYTIGGLSLRIIAEAMGTSYEWVEEALSRDEIKFRGPYISAQYGNEVKHFIPAPLNLVNGKIVDLEYNVDDDIGYEKLSGMKIARLKLNPQIKLEPVAGFRLAELSFDKEKLKWKIELSSLAVLNAKLGERTSFEMDRKRRVVKPHTLYFKSVIEKYLLKSGRYGVTEEILISCDLTVPNDVGEALIKQKTQIVKVGGEGGLAIAEVDEKVTPLIDVESSKSSNTYLAVSHIPILKINGELRVGGFGKVDWLYGTVVLLGGWDLRRKELKKHVPALVPGSIFKISSQNQSIELKDWYFNLLKSAIPLKVK